MSEPQNTAETAPPRLDGWRYDLPGWYVKTQERYQGCDRHGNRKIGKTWAEDLYHGIVNITLARRQLNPENVPVRDAHDALVDTVNRGDTDGIRALTVQHGKKIFSHYEHNASFFAEVNFLYARQSAAKSFRKMAKAGSKILASQGDASAGAFIAVDRVAPDLLDTFCTAARKNTEKQEALRRCAAVNETLADVLGTDRKTVYKLADIQQASARDFEKHGKKLEKKLRHKNEFYWGVLPLKKRKHAATLRHFCDQMDQLCTAINDSERQGEPVAFVLAEGAGPQP